MHRSLEVKQYLVKARGRGQGHLFVHVGVEADRKGEEPEAPVAQLGYQLKEEQDDGGVIHGDAGTRRVDDHCSHQRD